MLVAWSALTQGLTTRFTYPWWAYGVLPLAAIGLEMLGALPHAGYLLLAHPAALLHSTMTLVRALLAHLDS